MDYTKLKVADLRRMLVEKGLDQAFVDEVKGKANLIALWEATAEAAEATDFDMNELDDNIDELLSGMDDEDLVGIDALLEEEAPEPLIKPNEVVSYDDVEDAAPTTQFVSHEHDNIMEMFTEDELLDGKYPKAVGLRIVTGKPLRLVL